MRSALLKPPTLLRKAIAILIAAGGIVLSFWLAQMAWGLGVKKEGAAFAVLALFGGGSIALALLYYDYRGGKTYRKRRLAHELERARDSFRKKHTDEESSPDTSSDQDEGESQMIEQLTWEFPLPRTHTGMLLGNATMGAMVWGEGATLRITIGRADLWDHRGGMPWTETQNYQDIRRCLETNDEAGLRELFVTKTEAQSGQPNRPSVVPVGRVELGLGDGAMLQSGTINMQTGEMQVVYEQGGAAHTLTLILAMAADVLAVKHDPDAAITVSDLPAWDTLGGDLEQRSFAPPERLTGEAIDGWVQEMPVDPGLAVLHQNIDNTLWIATARGDDSTATLDAGKALLSSAIAAGHEAMQEENAAWWADYWRDVPVLHLPNEEIEALYVYGMYKFAGFSQPAGTAGTLQGPWIEEYQMPPWSSDYHFNINVQMCYWPAFKANKLAHLMPLFDMVFSWEETLAQNARVFIGIDDGVMLPHAVDDRCTCMGGFWTGCIDHACTAWVAQMMFDYASYSGDVAFLREKAYPFMKKTMRVYEAMLERDARGYVLPVSVSPEYHGSAMNAWGANASFQLASIHRLLENLHAAAELLGDVPALVWQQIADGLPKACLIGDEGVEQIALWQDTPLEESHRHHSHLGGICPFDIIDLEDETWRPIADRSFRHWVGKGMGMWSGWCVPWASMLQSRCGNGEMAELLLTIWESVFTNEGRGTLHDCEHPGLTLMGAGSSIADGGQRREVMQLDAGLGVVVAIQDMLLHTRRGVHHLFAGVPKAWPSCSFEKMLTEGGFLVSASRTKQGVERVEITAQHSGTFRLANPWPGEESSNGAERLSGKVLELAMSKGATVVLVPAGEAS